jgi:hypothetical protein
MEMNAVTRAKTVVAKRAMLLNILVALFLFCSVSCCHVKESVVKKIWFGE